MTLSLSSAEEIRFPKPPRTRTHLSRARAHTRRREIVGGERKRASTTSARTRACWVERGERNGASGGFRACNYVDTNDLRRAAEPPARMGGRRERDRCPFARARERELRVLCECESERPWRNQFKWLSVDVIDFHFTSSRGREGERERAARDALLLPVPSRPLLRERGEESCRVRVCAAGKLWEERKMCMCVCVLGTGRKLMRVKCERASRLSAIWRAVGRATITYVRQGACQ